MLAGPQFSKPREIVGRKADMRGLKRGVSRAMPARLPDPLHPNVIAKKGITEVKKLSRILSVLMALCLVVTVMPTVAWAKSNSYVMLHPSSGTTPTGVKVQVGDRINGYEITSISGYDIKIDLGTYNVSLNNFRIPMPEEVWEGVAMQYNPQTYVIAGTAGAAHKTPGSNALLGNGGNTFYYYNLGKASGGGGGGDSYLWNFTLQYDANGGTGAPATQTYGTDDKYEKSYGFTIPYTKPTRNGYTFVGWSDSRNGSATKQPGEECKVFQTAGGYNGGSVTKTLYAVWEKETVQEQQYTYKLIYNANGKGSTAVGMPGNQEGKTDLTSYTFDVKSGPTCEGYTFKGWSLTSGENNSIDYEAGDGMTVTMPTGKTEHTWRLYAVWELEQQEQVTLTYMDRGDIYTTQTFNKGDIATIISCTNTWEGYTFLGWSTVSSAATADWIADSSMAMNSDTTLYAVWQQNAPPAPTTYTVRYTDGVDGEEVFADQITENLPSGATTPAFVGTPTREGYEFVGWTPEVEATVTDNVIYTARWEEVEETVYTYRLAYEANAGDSTVSGMPAGKTVKTDAAAYVFSVSSDRPAREGYTFQGWSTTAGGPVEYQGGDRIYLPGVPGEEISVTLFAVWEKSPVPPTPVDPDPKPDPDPDPEPDPYIPPYIPPTPVRPDPDPVRPDPDVEILDEEVPLAGAIGLNLEDHFAYIAGYPDGTVRPDGNITRAEVATIFFRLLTEETRAIYWSQTNDYSDVAPEAWYNNAVSTLSSMEVLSGYPDGTFKPNAPITRAEFAKIAVSFFDCAGIVYDGTFSDVAEGQWWTEYIAAAAELGLVEGYPDGTFKPQANISRAESCAIVNRVLERKPHEEHLLPEAEMIVWPDNADKAVWYYADIQEATNSHDYELAETETAEQWTEKLPERDWPALEQEWADASAAPGGEVIG